MSVTTGLINRLRAAARAFVLGPAAVTSSDVAWGHDPSTFAPESYGNYAATSNGVYACIKLRSSLLSSLDLELYRGEGKDRAEVDSGALYSLLHQVNPFWTFNRLLEMTEMSLCLWGSAFWFLERGQTGTQPPREIWWGRPDRVTIMPDPAEYIRGFAYTGPDGSTLSYLPSEVIWFRYPNPIDEYSGLSPLAAARLAADTANAAMQSNRNLFTNGLQLGGVVTPKAGTTLTTEQAREIERSLEARFKGVDKAHRWGVFRFEANMSAVGTSPKDAEFLGALRWSLGDICRAYGVPPELVGDHENASYSNVEQANLAVWQHTMLPEAKFIAAEITEQLLPMFPREADEAEFDTSEISVLQPDRTAEWAIAEAQIKAGARTLNEWRADEGLDPLPWGDVWWAASSLAPVADGEPKPAPVPPVAPQVDTESPDPETMPHMEEAEPEELPAETPVRSVRGVGFGSPEHQRLFGEFVRRTDPHEKRVAQVVIGLFERQRASVLARLRGRAVRSPAEVLAEPFDRAAWLKTFRQTIRPEVKTVVLDAGNVAFEALGLSVAFDIKSPAVIRFLEARAQRFAEQVTDTTWRLLKETLGEGIDAGESIRELEDRVVSVMDGRIRSTPETIARTEVIGASNGGTMQAWQQTGLVSKKTWISALDDRTRTPDKGDAFDHVGAHNETVGLDEPFTKSGEPLDFPGADGGSAANVINCRCTMIAVME